MHYYVNIVWANESSRSGSFDLHRGPDCTVQGIYCWYCNQCRSSLGQSRRTKLGAYSSSSSRVATRQMILVDCSASSYLGNIYLLGGGVDTACVFVYVCVPHIILFGLPFGIQHTQQWPC